MEKIEKDGITYYRLYCPCPKHTGAGSHVSKHYWKHHHSLGDIYIGDNACLYSPLDATIVHITKWEFCCPQCSNAEDYYVQISSRGCTILNDYIGCVGSMVRQTGIAWLEKFIQNL